MEGLYTRFYGIYETKNYFGTAEGEFKAQYNGHKKSFTVCIDEKATELSNTFGTEKTKIKVLPSDGALQKQLVLTHVELDEAICAY